MNQLIKKYKAISQECRFRIIHLLLEARKPICICEMMDSLKKEQYQISRCLGILKDAGLVKEDRDGRLLLYSVDSSDKTNVLIFKSILNDEKISQLNNDVEALHKRLALRENDKVVVTYQD